MRGEEAILKLNEFEFHTVLDIGCGDGAASEFFKRGGKDVYSLDLTPAYPSAVIGDYMDIEFAPGQFDCIWSAHVLEHQPNVNLFLRKIYHDLADDGVLCLTVPPAKREVVSGHLSVWNAGLLVYNLLYAGFDCQGIRIKKYGYNISVILRKKAIPTDKRDFPTLAKYAPPFFVNGFVGNIQEHRW